MLLNQKQLNFVKHFFGILLLLIGLIGTVLPIMPGIVIVGFSLSLLQDIRFFKNINDRINKEINNILPDINKIIKKANIKKKMIT